jgi:hypothetical protein
LASDADALLDFYEDPDSDLHLIDSVNRAYDIEDPELDAAWRTLYLDLVERKRGTSIVPSSVTIEGSGRTGFDLMLDEEPFPHMISGRGPTIREVMDGVFELSVPIIVVADK